MAIFVDFIGLNTLIQENVDTTTNTVGNSLDAAVRSYLNSEIKSIHAGDYLAGLNIHRNGPYGFPIFRQLRAGDSPIIRRQRLDNTFTHYEYPGKQFVVHGGTKQRTVISQKRAPVERFSEVPVVSKHKPLKLVGSVTTFDKKTELDVFEEVEVFTTLGNKTQYFSNAKINKFFDVEETLDNDYENFIDLYLEGGLDGDESPIDEFQKVQYRQVVYPKGKYTYKHHTRNRPNFVSRYWRDSRLNRTERDISDNGFGFSVFSQSVWVLDGEQDFENLTFNVTPGAITLSHPSNYLTGNYGGTHTSASALSFTYWKSSVGAVGEKSIVFTHPKDSDITMPVTSHDQDKMIPYYPAGFTFYDYPERNNRIGTFSGSDGAKILVASNPYDVSANRLLSVAGVQYRYNDSTSRREGIKDLFEKDGFSVEISDVNVLAAGLHKAGDGYYGVFDPIRMNFNNEASGSLWRTFTTSSCVSVWTAPPQDTVYYGSMNMYYDEIFLTGTLYSEYVTTASAFTTDTDKRKLSKLIQFKPWFNGSTTHGKLICSLGVVFTSSIDGSDIFIGADEPGAVQYEIPNVFGSNNPIYNAANATNSGITSYGAAQIAKFSANHWFVDLNLSGTHLEADDSKRQRKFQDDHNGSDTFYPAQLYINGDKVSNSEITISDPYHFLTGALDSAPGTHASHNPLGGRQQWLKDGNTSIYKPNGEIGCLQATAWPTISAFTSTGFSFSYWVRFREDPTALTTAGATDISPYTLFLATSDTTGDRVAEMHHGVGYYNSESYFEVGFNGTAGGAKFTKVYRHALTADLETDVWYNVSFSFDKTLLGSPRVKVFKKGAGSPITPSGASSGWITKVGSAGDLSQGEFAALSSSAELHVLPSQQLASTSGLSPAMTPFDFVLSDETLNPNSSFDALNIDNLIFWNGALSDHQMEALVSGSHNTDNTGLAGDGTPTISTSNYPASDTTKGLKVITSPAVLRGGTIGYELNTWKGELSGAHIQQTWMGNEHYRPFGSKSPAWFQTNVIDAGDSGEFSFAAQIKPTHRNVDTRGLRSPSWDYPAAEQHFQTELGSQKWSTANQNHGSGHPYGKPHEGFFISFWYKAGVATMSAADEVILMSQQGGFHVTRGGTDRDSGGHNKGPYSIVLTINHHDSSDSNLDGSYQFSNNEGSWNFPSATTITDTDWHHVAIWWNGRFCGREAEACFKIDGGSLEYVRAYDNYEAGYGTMGVAGYGSTGWRNRHVAPHAQQRMYVGAAPLGLNYAVNSSYKNRGVSLAQLAIITDMPNPEVSETYASYIYNYGNRSDLTYTSLADELASLAVDNGGDMVVRKYDSDMDNPSFQYYGDTTQGGWQIRVFNNDQSTGGNMTYPAWETTGDKWSSPPSHGKAEGYTWSFSWTIRGGNSTQWLNDNNWWLLDAFNSNSSAWYNKEMWRIASLADDDRLSLHVRENVGVEKMVGYWDMSDMIDAGFLTVGSEVHILFTWTGEMDAAGRPENVHLYLDGTEISWTSGIYAPYANNTLSDWLGPGGELTKFSVCGPAERADVYAGSGTAYPNNNFAITHMRFFNYYMGGSSTVAVNARNALRITRTHEHTLNHWDPQWKLPQLSGVLTRDAGSGTTSTTINKGDFIAPLVDTPLCGGLDHIISNIPQTFHNHANRTPTIRHYYHLGTEPELFATPTFQETKGVLLNNSGSNYVAYPLSASVNSKLVPVFNWQDDNYGNSGRRTSTGQLQQWTYNVQTPMQLLNVSDNRDASTPRNDWYGLEAYLERPTNASGLFSESWTGEYRIKVVLRTRTPGSDATVSRSYWNTQDACIRMEEWASVYITFDDLSVGDTLDADSVKIFVDGTQKPTTFVDVNDSCTEFKPLTTTSTATQYRPAVGIYSNGYSEFPGFIQDICFWDNGSVWDRPNGLKNYWDNFRTGSTYVDTSDSNLLLACKTGYNLGSNWGTIREIAGSLQGSVSAASYGLSTDKYNQMDSPPIPVFESDGGFTVISFWSEQVSNNTYETILDLRSHVAYDQARAKTSALQSTSEKTDIINPSDSNNPNNEADFYRGTSVFNIKLKLYGGLHTAKIQCAGLMDEGTLATWPIGKDYMIRSEIRESTGENVGTGLKHHVFFISKNYIAWHVDGTLRYVFYDDTNDINRYFDASRQNGWSEVIIGPEHKSLQVNSQIDEVVIMKFPSLSTTECASYATTFYNGGGIYNFDAFKTNVVAWWRMGENIDGDIETDTQLAHFAEIEDRGMPPGTSPSTTAKNVRRDLTSTYSNRWKVIDRTSGQATDLRNHYTFIEESNTNPRLPLAGDLSNDTRFADSISSYHLYTRHNDLEKDFSFDSYDLLPKGWLSQWGTPVKMIVAGADEYDSAGHASEPAPPTRLWHSTYAGYGGFGYAGLDDAWTGDFAVFSGTVNDTNDKSKHLTTLKINEAFVAGEVLTFLVNPRYLTGSPIVFKVNIVAEGTTDTAFTAAAAGEMHDYEAEITIASDPTIENQIDALIVLIETDAGASGLNIVEQMDDTVDSGVNKVGTDTITIQASSAGSGNYDNEVRIDHSVTSKVTVSTVLGQKFTRALVKRPSFGWVQQNGLNFVSTNSDSQFNGLKRTKDILGTGTDETIQPIVYFLNTYRVQPEQPDGWNTTVFRRGGAYESNIGLLAGSELGGADEAGWTKFVLTASATDSKFSPQQQVHLMTWYTLDSGSTVEFELKNTPQLDINYIDMQASPWALSDSIPNFLPPSTPQALIGGSSGARATYGPGLLQNSYNQFTQQISTGSSEQLDPQLSASACYFRRHTLTASTSFVSPSSGFLEKLTASYDPSSIKTHLIGNMSSSHLYLGSAKWEAGDFAGTFDDDGVFTKRPKKPFYDSYPAFIEEARPLMKDYGIVPEFKMSEHVQKYLVKGPTEQKLDFLNITGGLESADTSNKQDFYEIYSTTDFLKHFEVVQEDHSDFVDPFSIKLRCSVVKKFLPYEGFYPAQRSVDIAKQFYESYGANINITGNYDMDGSNNYGIQYLLNPLFSPGILYNTIKSGVAVDFPLITDTGSVAKITGEQDGGAMITQQFDTRVPFEALIEPEKHLANVRLASNEPDPNGDTGATVTWGGQGNELYNLMVSNFLAETSEFFLENKTFTTLASLPQGDANFGNAKAGDVYMMRLKMFRTTTGVKFAGKNHAGKSFGFPQDIIYVGENGVANASETGSVRSAFTMYSRPSAFGPPQYLSGSDYTAQTWAGYKFFSSSIAVDGVKNDFSYVTGSTYGTTDFGAIGNEAHKGYNYPFTPPYYHGEAWADVTFIPKESKKYTLQEIINNSSVEYYRYFLSSSQGVTSAIPGVHDSTVVVNDQAMQIASSVNIFSQGVLEQDITAQGAEGINNTTNVQVDTDISNRYRWIVQTKFETPMLNFQHYTYGTHSVGDYDGSQYGITLPGVGPMQTPIGMWHQYGHIPQNPREGVFLQIDNVPKNWVSNAMHKPKATAIKYNSLAELCGFSTEPVRMGEISGLKEVSEAVVAIPFFERGGRRRFFRMRKHQIRFAQDPSKVNLVGETVVDMVEKMKKYVIPPQFDFVSFPEITPFSMYIFEFTHNFNKQELADMWQNLPPELHTTVETDEVAISHELLAHELLGRGGRYRRGRNSEWELLRNDRSESLNPEIQWMVFKVKKRAKSNYFEKIFARNESQQLLSERLKLGVSADALGKRTRISYNWPYDFFSLIEGIKLTAEVDFLEVDEEATMAQDKPVPKPKQKSSREEKERNKTVSKDILKAVSGLITPEELKEKLPHLPSADEKKKKRGRIKRERRIYGGKKNLGKGSKKMSNINSGKKRTKK